MPTHWIDRADRHASSAVADVTGPTIASFRARIRNVSASGMLIETPHALTIGDVLNVRTPKAGAVLCVVIRNRPGAAGLRFVNSADGEDLSVWL